jgi:myo-inositol-1(or 4)-monophosphatase
MPDFLNIAREAALLGGEILVKHFGRLRPEDIRQKQANDFLSFVDQASEAAIISHIHQHFPDHTIMAEESGFDNRDQDYTWIIDPLDGTTNYLKGIPVFAVSIALKQGQDLTAGVVYDPLRNELFSAARGQGAWLNGQRLQIPDSDEIGRALIATGFPFKNQERLSPYLAMFRNIFPRTIGIRRMGAAAIDLAYVAAGRFDGFWEMGLKPWDMAAGALLIREAGGRVSDFWNGDQFLHTGFLTAGNPAVHKMLISEINKVMPFFETTER